MSLCTFIKILKSNHNTHTHAHLKAFKSGGSQNLKYIIYPLVILDSKSKHATLLAAVW